DQGTIYKDACIILVVQGALERERERVHKQAVAVAGFIVKMKRSKITVRKLTQFRKKEKDTLLRVNRRNRFNIFNYTIFAKIQKKNVEIPTGVFEYIRVDTYITPRVTC
ncbi:hypothetical protein ACJX0J_023261, partial [Zea mays]